MSSGSAAASRPTLPLLQFLAQPWLDRTIAFIAMVPLLYLTYYRYEHMRLGVPLLSFAIGTLIAFVTMILRRPPKKSHAKSSVLAARICGNVLAPPDAWDNPEGSASGITPRNVLILGLGILWFLIKSIVEENFLRADPQYAAYLQRVRARWIPFVV
jgi:hypothetical protein